MSTAGMQAERNGRWGFLLVLLIVVAYAPSFGAGFLNYDDNWLYQENPLLGPEAFRTPVLAFTDFSRETRLILGAEYLPVRDLFVWFQTRLFGIWAPGMHAFSVGLYVAAALLFRGALLRCLGRSFTTELAAALFAVHPVHAESVAWLAGQKDVLALCFVGAALFIHAGGRAHGRWSVPLLVLLASLSKSMSVAVLGLLLSQDLVMGRRPDGRLYAGSIAVVALAMSAHVYVGSLVGMVAEPLGGSRHHALLSMGPVWLRYLALCVAPWNLSISHDVPVRTEWDLPAVCGTLFVVAALVFAGLTCLRGKRRPAYLALWFFVPLAPVSQVLVPLQNSMADRYLWLSVMAPCLFASWAIGWAVARGFLSPVFSKVTGAAMVLVLTGATFDRTLTFSDSVLLFLDGTAKTVLEPDAPYQLGKALEEAGREDDAIVAFQEVLRRTHGTRNRADVKASNNLARLLARRGALAEAEAVLRASLERFPNERKLRGNLSKVLRTMNRHQEADELDATKPR